MMRAYSNQSGGPSSICGRGQADVVERHAHERLLTLASQRGEDAA
jgi:hypothetical protein